MGTCVNAEPLDGPEPVAQQVLPVRNLWHAVWSWQTLDTCTRPDSHGF